jgi:hypothetical protein
MSKKSLLLAALVVVATACGDAGGVTGTGGAGGTGGEGGFAGEGGAGGETGAGGAGGLAFLGDCGTHADCEGGGYAACVPEQYDGLIPPAEVEEGTPGACIELNSMGPSVYIHDIAPGTNTEQGFVVNPRAEYHEVLSVRTYRHPASGNGEWDWEGAITYPYASGTAPWAVRLFLGLELNTRLVGIDDPSFEVECNLVFDELGLVEGGVVIGAGQESIFVTSSLIVCPTDEPGSPGILIEAESYGELVIAGSMPGL